LLLETGIRQVAAAPPNGRPHGPAVRLLWSGDLQTWKALPLLLRALAQLPPDVPYEMRIIGRGPLKDSWQRLSRRLGVEPHTTWMGWLPFLEALRQYAWADLFLFTSLRDTSGNVLLEALGAGLPVICLDHQGAHDIVTEECGIKVPVTHPTEVIAGLREA